MTRDTVLADTRTRFALSSSTASQRPSWSPDGTRVAFDSDPTVPGGDRVFVGSTSYNHAPRLTAGSVRDTVIIPGRTWRRTLSATDPDGEPVTYDMPMAPPGVSLGGATLSWTARNSDSGLRYIVVRAMDGSGGVSKAVIEVEVAGPMGGNLREPDPNETAALPVEFALSQNEPNPADGGTLIRFSLPAARMVRIDVLDIDGRVVRTLVDERRDAGYHSVVWDGSTANGRLASPGVYVYAIRAGNFTARKKLVLIR